LLRGGDDAGLAVAAVAAVLSRGRVVAAPAVLLFLLFRPPLALLALLFTSLVLIPLRRPVVAECLWMRAADLCQSH
jgi:hypothetical protein